MNKHTLLTQDLCMIGMLTAIIAIMAQISIPMPLGVPMTMQTFAVMLAGIILGPPKGALATFIYILIGAIGLPVFSNFTGGFQCLVGPTGGFIISFPLMAWLIGLGTEYRTRFKGVFTLALIAGNVLNLLCGAILFSLLQKVSFSAAVATCIVPFIPVTILKIILAAVAGLNMRRRLASGSKIYH